MQFPENITSYVMGSCGIIAVNWTKSSDNTDTLNPQYLRSEIQSDGVDSEAIPTWCLYDDLCLCVKQAKKKHIFALKKSLSEKQNEIAKIQASINAGESELKLSKTKFLQNRYNEQGILNYHDRNLDNDMSTFVKDIMKAKGFKLPEQALATLLGAAYTLVQDYDLHCNFGDNNLGGGLTSKEWLNQPIKNAPVVESLRPYFKEFIESNIVPQEFAHEVLASFYSAAMAIAVGD